MLENLLEYFRKSDGDTKKKVLYRIFAEKLVLETWNKVMKLLAAEIRELQPVERNSNFKIG